MQTTQTFAAKVKNDFDAHTALQANAAKVTQAYKATAWQAPAPRRNRQVQKPALLARLVALFF